MTLPSRLNAVTIELMLAEAERISAAMADLLCWCSGFAAACPDDTNRHPPGVSATRDLRIKLLSALGRDGDLPF